MSKKKRRATLAPPPKSVSAGQESLSVHNPALTQRLVRGEVLNALYDGTISFPTNQRVGQFISNALSHELTTRGDVPTEDRIGNLLFYITDEELHDILHNWLDKCFTLGEAND